MMCLGSYAIAKYVQIVLLEIKRNINSLYYTNSKFA